MKEITNFSELSTNGIYVLLLFLSKEVKLNIGKLVKKSLSEGHYTYTGSALGKGASSLKHRIARHLRKKKRKFWHIDYLLANENVSVEAVIIAETNYDMECNINWNMKGTLGAKIPIRGLGASDCRKNCGSHLLYFPDIRNADFLVQKIVKNLQSSAGILSVSVVHQRHSEVACHYAGRFSSFCRFLGINNRVKKTPARKPPK